MSWCDVSDVHWCSDGCVVSDESKDLNFQVVAFHRSAVGLWDHSHERRFDDGAGHRFFWRLSSKLTDQIPDHVQQEERLRNLGGPLQLLEFTGNGGRALHVPPVEPVGESVPSFCCCLGGIHNLAGDTCCKSLHRKVDMFVKLGDPCNSQSIVLLSFGNELVLSHSCICAANLNSVSKSWSIRSTHDENSSDH